jgi:hypothetical protein
MDDYSMMIFLEAGENKIMPSRKYESRKGCGIIPLGGKVEKIQTSGLKINFGNKDDPLDSLDFSEVISTSNTMVDEVIIINNSDPVLFCTTLNFAPL